MDPTKARLLEAAGEEFAEKGFTGATVRSICKKADANVASVNYHFGDKERLYVQAVMEAHRCGVAPDGVEPDLGSGPPAERVRRFVRGFLQNVLAVDRDRSWHHELLLRELIRPSMASDILVREVIRPRFLGLRSTVRELVPDADDQRLDAICFSIIGQCLHYKIGRNIGQRLVGPEQFSAMNLDFLADHIARFTLAAIGAGPTLKDETGPSAMPAPDFDHALVPGDPA